MNKNEEGLTGYFLCNNLGQRWSLHIYYKIKNEMIPLIVFICLEVWFCYNMRQVMWYKNVLNLSINMVLP